MTKEKIMQILTKIKIKNAFYTIDDESLPSEDICSLNRDEIYVYLYDEEKGRDVGQWRKASDFIDIGRR